MSISILNSKLTKLLPQDIIDYILTIVGYHKYRNGNLLLNLTKQKIYFPS